MKTTHSIFFGAAQNMSSINDKTVDLVVTSPPYPMIEMWDEIMSQQNPAIGQAFVDNKPMDAFELMHQELDKVWKECYRVLKEGAFLCINIGDATRTINKEFALYNNNTRIINACIQLGFTNLPNILWKKTTNAPNKFMGSGMLPCGAYVTLEHEWILIFRKGKKREYKKAEEKLARKESSFFWEERNVWFSDIWELKGVRQNISNTPTRERNASYPLELPYRLINMYSQAGDTVLDPFMGLGTTTMAAIVCQRNSIGMEIDPALNPLIRQNIMSMEIDKVNSMIKNRVDKHKDFVVARINDKKEVKHDNLNLNCKVMTSQETDITFHYLKSLRLQTPSPLVFECEYEDQSDLNHLPLPFGMTL